MSRYITISNYEAIDADSPKFKSYRSTTRTEVSKVKADWLIGPDGAPPDLPAAYRFDGTEYISSDRTEWTGVPYNLADKPGNAELHTLWVRLYGDTLQLFLGSRMIAVRVVTAEDDTK